MKEVAASEPVATPAATVQQQDLPQNDVSLEGNVAGPFLQAKLSVGAPDDALEHEADNVADKVVNMPENSFIQHKTHFSEGRKAQLSPLTGSIQKKNDISGTAVPSDVGRQIESSKGGGNTMDEGTKSFMESRFGTEFSDVKIHTGAESGQLSKALNAQAFTVGKDIYFNQDKYNPGTKSGKRLLAHELTHTIQQGDVPQSVQRDTDVVNMPPMTITAGMPDTSSLTTPVPAGSMTASRPQADIELNSQLPETVLPFTAGGWDGNDIANKLGQYDRMPGTDSDTVRCVQAVALMSHILMGPAAAISYLSAISLQGLLQAPQVGTRERTAMRVIDFVKSRITSRQATYGNMYWAMEAVHDLFFADNAGTPAANANTVRSQITPSLDLSQNMVNMDVWCNNRAEVLTQASSLNPGEQLMLNTWAVSFNSTFDMAGLPTTQQTGTITQVDEQGRNPRNVFIRRIDASHKPRANQIDNNRDSKAGHQMLIYKDSADSHIKMYEPEITTSGKHSFDLTADPSVIDTSLFSDQPSFELYHYVQIWGKIVPSSLTTPFNP
ncbi:DUF4157 domain-containing protein [Mucilaginibacter sp.]|uniref:eCIS core domain-containing protein n=1 Tax=Mucilaginibacter sp. TaxID=1882438 RepID=UPI0025CBE717|nr:DUF4157 domain-containing protein [Mucilaginibacter sp.]